MTLTDLPDPISALLLLPFLGAAVATDVMDRQIPNLLIVSMLGVGVLIQAATGSPIDVLWSLAGIAVGLLMFLPFYALGGMAAGDVKLLAAAGSFVGPTGALLAGLFSLTAGVALALGWIGCRRFHARWSHRSSGAGAPAKTYLPYSLAVAAGTLISVTQW